MDELLLKIRDFANKAHGNQKRKYTPEPYIVHPERVMNICKAYTEDIGVLGAALLHDVLEDTSTTKDQIRNFISELLDEELAERMIKYVVELTDIYEKKHYPNWNRKKRRSREAKRLAKVSGEAQTVKYADILDNCREIVVHDPDFAKRFLSECNMLLRHMDKGNPDLFHETWQLVNEQLALLLLTDEGNVEN